MSSTAFITGRIRPGTVFPYQTGFAYTVEAEDGNTYHMRNVTYDAAAKAKAAMRDAVASHNMSLWKSKRLSSDAAIVLRNAGFDAKHGDFVNGKSQSLLVEGKHIPLERLEIIGGCVNNERVEELLKEMR